MEAEILAQNTTTYLILKGYKSDKAWEPRSEGQKQALTTAPSPAAWILRSSSEFSFGFCRRSCLHEPFWLGMSEFSN